MNTKLSLGEASSPMPKSVIHRISLVYIVWGHLWIMQLALFLIIYVLLNDNPLLLATAITRVVAICLGLCVPCTNKVHKCSLTISIEWYLHLLFDLALMLLKWESLQVQFFALGTCWLHRFRLILKTSLCSEMSCSFLEEVVFQTLLLSWFGFVFIFPMLQVQFVFVFIFPMM